MTNFWKNKKILITGINGFIGSNLAKKLVSYQAKVFGIYSRNNKNLKFLMGEDYKKISLVKINLLNYNLINKFINKNNFQFVFHLAAQSDMIESIKKPYETLEKNIRGSYNLLNSFLKNKAVKSILITSSDRVYGANKNKGFKKFNEDTSLNPIFPYDVSKVCMENISKSYSSDLFNLPILVTRLSNVYGPGHLNYKALIPNIIKSIILNKDFEPVGNGLETRNYTYIDDIVYMQLKLSELLSKNKKLSGQTFNLGSDFSYKSKQIIDKFFKMKNKNNELKIIHQKMKNKKKKSFQKIKLSSYSKINKYIRLKKMSSIDSKKNIIYDWYLKKLNKHG